MGSILVMPPPSPCVLKATTLCRSIPLNLFFFGSVQSSGQGGKVDPLYGTNPCTCWAPTIIFWDRHASSQRGAPKPCFADTTQGLGDSHAIYSDRASPRHLIRHDASFGIRNTRYQIPRVVDTAPQLWTHLHVTALHTSGPISTSLHSTPLDPSPRHCTPHLWTHPHITALHTSGPISTSLHSTPLDPSPRHCTPHLWTHLHVTALHTSGPISTSLHSTPLDPSPRHCTPHLWTHLHVTALHTSGPISTSLHSTPLDPSPRHCTPHLWTHPHVTALHTSGPISTSLHYTPLQA